MKGDFEQAVNNNEISAYLKGEGDYFSPWEMIRGNHNDIDNWMGMIGYLSKKEHPYQLLIKYFKLYLSSLKEDVLDAWSLFNSISCYYYLRKENYFFLTENEDLIDELTVEEKKKIGVLYRYLRENFDKVPDAAEMNPFDVQIKGLKKRNCPYDFLSF